MKKRKLKKKSKNLIVAIFVFLLVLLVFFLVFKVFFQKEESAIYGNRLEGIEKVELTKSKKEKIKDNLEDISEDISIRTQGKIINIKVVLNENVSRSDAKKMGEKVTSALSKEQLEFYDIQLFVDKVDTEDAKLFPIIGYKNHSSDKFTWTKDR